MKINFNFDDAVMEGITLLLCENEIPYIIGGSAFGEHSLWFEVMTTTTKKPWLVSILYRNGIMLLRAKRGCDCDTILLAKHILNHDDFAGLVFFAKGETRESTLSKEISNPMELSKEMAALFAEIEYIESDELEFVELRNLPFWLDILTIGDKGLRQFAETLDLLREEFDDDDEDIEDEFPF